MRSIRPHGCARQMRGDHCARAPYAPWQTVSVPISSLVILLLAGCHAYPPCGGYQRGYPAYQTMPPGPVMQQSPQMLPGNVQARPAPNPVARTDQQNGFAPPRAAPEKLPWDPADEKPAANFGSGFDAGSPKKDGLVPNYKFDPSGSGTVPGSAGADGSLSDTNSNLTPNAREPFRDDAAIKRPASASDGGFTGPDPFKSGSTTAPGSSSGNATKPLKPFSSSDDTNAVPRKTGDIFDELEQRKRNTEKKVNQLPSGKDREFTPFKEEEYESGSAAVQPPMRITPAMSARPIINVSNETAQIPDSVYGFDRVGYRWLRGSLDYDHEDGSWQIMYDRDPDPADPYGGVLTLGDDPRLRALKKSDVVVVAGYVDETAEDSFGKPVFHLDKIDVFE